MALSVFLWKLFIRSFGKKYSFRISCNGVCSFAGNIWAWGLSCTWCSEQTSLTFLLPKVIHKLLGDSQRCWLFSLSSLFHILSRESSCLGCLWQRSVLADSISPWNVGRAPSCRAGSARAGQGIGLSSWAWQSRVNGWTWWPWSSFSTQVFWWSCNFFAFLTVKGGKSAISKLLLYPLAQQREVIQFQYFPQRWCV